MAENPPPLDATSLLNVDLSLLPPLVNGDGTQVILVQVNPGETFTIRREDGQLQCITGPAQVPMVSPNGSVPPIYVPPGYVSQVIEESGVRRVLVLPQQPEFHPGSHPPIHPHPYMPTFLHPPVLPHHQMYSTGPGDVSTQYVPQHHPPHSYTDQESHPTHGRSNYIHRDERTSKAYDRLQKKLKDRQANGSKDKISSPSSSPHKCHFESLTSEQNEQDILETCVGIEKSKQDQKKEGTSEKDTDMSDEDANKKALEALLSVSKPMVSDIQARTVVLTWAPPSATINDDAASDFLSEPYSYEVAISNGGKDEKFKIAYVGKDESVTLHDLKPATDYQARVQAVCNLIRGAPSDSESFRTLCSEPDTPMAPRIINRTKHSLSLQWKASCDNGSKVTNYILEWDEGKGTNDFSQCYSGLQKQFKVTKLSPSVGYRFKLAAKNDVGMSDFSEEVLFYTSGSVPPTPAGPQLLKAGVTWLSLHWSKPSGTLSDEGICYILEMEDETSGYGFKPKYDGEDLACTIKNLRRGSMYKFRVIAYNSEGKSNPSEITEFTTLPDKPGMPSKPLVKGKIHAHNFKIIWDPPKDNGGSAITKYVVEMSEGINGNRWDIVYSGSAREHICDHLNPGFTYQLRVYCISKGGQSLVSETLQVQTAAVPPGPCHPPRLTGKPRARELQLHWGQPPVTGGSQVISYKLEIFASDLNDPKEVYQGPDMECTVSNLLPGRIYGFRLRAANKTGYGPFSEKCEICTAAACPDQCKAPQVTCKTATCVHVSWTVPADNGADVTEYRLEWGVVEGMMQICYCGPGLSYEMKGLQPATTYFCRVQALNIAGAGPFSDVVLCMTPASVPAAVGFVQVMDEDQLDVPLDFQSTCLAIQWEEPCDHGSEITNYSIDFGERQPIIVDRTTSHVIGNLQPDTTYRLRVQAINSIGPGPFSHTIKAKTKPLPPEPPRIECVASSHQTLKLKWGEGTAKTLASEAIQYVLQMEDKNGRYSTLYRGPCHTYKVQRLSESTCYRFKIQACNEAGEGPLSEVYTFMTTISPPSPLKAPRLEQLKENVCDLIWEPLPAMKGDPIVYSVQAMVGKDSEFKQIYKGPETTFQVSNLQLNCEYRFRVCAIRQCQGTQGFHDLVGPYSASVTLYSQRNETPTSSSKDTTEVTKAAQTLSDEQCAALILALFAAVSVLIAFIVQYFVIK
ncbi:fibronectin type-III domain-containing protein 3A isoform X2 [Hypanus sabinus]|uniref:fibronectin type-III domain-containing protein 3A isoform X2 n=1 Tax=Hypanus sabinus TaxID=79690 RepID=UPI0028C473C0|nr:fibronectin type-III domain-containing protein 3A isoform X2 [Hypanus sabinus]